MKPALAFEPVHWQGEVVVRQPPPIVRRAGVCARMTGSLLGIRGVEDFAKIQRFSIVERLCFETRSDALKSMISQS